VKGKVCIFRVGYLYHVTELVGREGFLSIKADVSELNVGSIVLGDP